MDLEKILKNLKNIEPDKEYTRNSRLMILNTQQKNETDNAGQGLFSYFFTKRKIITAVSLAAIFAVFAMSGFFKDGNRSNLPALDPISLKAEAQAIDIQIKLANLAYDNPELIYETTTTQDIVSDIKPNTLILLEKEDKKIEILAENPSTSSASEEDPVSVEEILKIISQ